jgi:hypothetical protein
VDRSDIQGPGDYGYDLAHEDVRAGRAPDDGSHPGHPGPPPRRKDSDRAEDLAYDEAHDF